MPASTVAVENAPKCEVRTVMARKGWRAMHLKDVVVGSPVSRMGRGGPPIGIRKRRLLARLSAVGSTLLVVGLLVSTFVPPEQATADNANDSVLARQPQLQPSTQGAGSVAALQYADPAAGLTVMAPPEPTPGAPRSCTTRC